MAVGGRFFVLLFIVCKFDIFQSKLNVDTRPLARSYDYWVSVVGEITNRQNPIELLSFLDRQSLLPDPFKKAENESSSRWNWNRSQPNIFIDSASKLKSYVVQWKRALSESCSSDLLRASSALINLGLATIKQCEIETNESECVEKQKSIVQENLWILQIINSYGVPRPGLFHQGQYLWFGSYHQCRYTSVPTSENTTSPARYCMVSFGASAEEIMQPGEDESRLRMKWGTCIPDGCVKDQTSDLLSLVISSVFNSTRLIIASKALQTISRYDIFCESLNEPVINGPGQIIFLVVFCVLLALIFVGTIVDYRSEKWALKSKVEKKLSSLHLPKMGLEPESNDACGCSIGTPSVYSIINLPSIDIESVVSYKSRDSLKRNLKTRKWWMKIFKSFSIRLNVRWLFQTRDHDGRNSEASKRITCLYGIKSLTMIWVVVGHSYIFCLPHVSNLLFVANLLPRNVFAQLLLNSSLSVDTFFLISGLLTSYIWCHRMKSCPPEKQRLDSLTKWLVFYTHRLVRLLPPYALVLAFVSTWFSNLGSGPQWDPKRIYGVQCEDGNVWWRHLLLVNNLLSTNASSLCLPWMWHVAADVQMYLVAPIFLSLLWKVPKIGISAIVFVVIASTVGRGVVVVFERLPTNLILFLPNEHFHNDFRKYFETIYEKPYFRCGPYMIGVLTGWCLAMHWTKLQSMKVKLFTKIAAWLMICAFCIWPLFGMYPMYRWFYDQVYNGIYAAISRTLWSIGVAMIIVICHTEHGGTWVNPILSWKKFWPPARLTYSIYLTHELIMLYILYSMSTPIEFNSHLTILALCLLFLAFAYPVAFFNFVLIEAPALAAERLMFRRKPKRKKWPKVLPFDNMIDRSLLAKRWADVIVNDNGDGNGICNGNGNGNGDFDISNGGWANLYKNLTLENDPKNSPKTAANVPSKCSSSPDSNSAEVMIEPEIAFGAVPHEAILKNVIDDNRKMLNSLEFLPSPNCAEIRMLNTKGYNDRNENKNPNTSIASVNLEQANVEKL